MVSKSIIISRLRLSYQSLGFQNMKWIVIRSACSAEWWKITGSELHQKVKRSQKNNRCFQFASGKNNKQPTIKASLSDHWRGKLLLLEANAWASRISADILQSRTDVNLATGNCDNHQSWCPSVSSDVRLTVKLFHADTCPTKQTALTTSWF